MSNLKNGYILLALIILFTGCDQINLNKTTPEKKVVKTTKKTKIIKKKKIVKKIKKKKIVYKHCNTHRKTMAHASKYIIDEFEKGYFLQKDIIGAKAQLFLVESKSSSVFAKNINTANDSYFKHYKIAKKNRCNLKAFKLSPLKQIKNKIKSIEIQKVNK